MGALSKRYMGKRRIVHYNNIIIVSVGQTKNTHKAYYNNVHVKPYPMVVAVFTDTNVHPIIII